MTLAALATKDALVMGCDSLGSVTKRLVDPLQLNQFFDAEDDFKIKLDEHGKPLLKDFFDIYGKAQIVPFNHMTHVDKLFSLFPPLEIGVMTAGLSSIGDFTIKNLINQFKATDEFKRLTRNYTVKGLATKLLKFINGFYEPEFKSLLRKPELELMIGGYDKRKQLPTILRIEVHDNEIKQTLKNFGIVFGGQMTEIQRIVFGTDVLNKIRLNDRHKGLLTKYHEEISNSLKENRIDIAIPEPKDRFPLFTDDWDLEEFDANWGDFSERNAIECIRFFIDIMIKSQQFSNKLPTVGGDIHIALITKIGGFTLLPQD